MSYNTAFPHKLSRKGFELKFNKSLRCMELRINDTAGMFPLVVKSPEAKKIYCIDKTRSGGLKMSAI